MQTLDNIIYFPDVMPTFAALTDSENTLPQGYNGINILPLFYGKESYEDGKPVNTDDRLLYWEFPGKQRAARKGDWKCVTIKKNAPLELYNLREDPTESNNLAEKYPEMVEEFDKAMRAARKPSPNWPLPDDDLK